MKLAFIFAPETCGPRPLDFANIETSSRGLTGTDNSFLGYAMAMARRGHLVTIFAAGQKDRPMGAWQGCLVAPYEERAKELCDAALTWNATEALRDFPVSTARIVDIQVANLDCAVSGAFDFVDQFVAPSASAARRLEGFKQKGPPIAILPNGCDMAAYPPTEKIAGRCIYTSSPDRGLHVALQQWSRIRSVVPHAILRIFYHALPQWLAEVEMHAENAKKGWKFEDGHANRGRYCREVLPKLRDQGVEYVGSVSRRQMAKEYCEAECLAYSSQPLDYTETFGVAVLEGCASGAVPVLGPCDAFPELWNACPMTKGPVEQCADEWGDLVISVLRDGYDRSKLRAVAEAHDWWKLGKNLEDLILAVRGRK